MICLKHEVACYFYKDTHIFGFIPYLQEIRSRNLGVDNNNNVDERLQLSFSFRLYSSVCLQIKG